MKYWNKKLKAMTEYIPGEQPADLSQYIKLNTNESPFPPSPSVIAAIKDACNAGLRQYPSPNSDNVRSAFAHILGTSFTSENIFVSNGSDEIFTLLFRGFIDDDKVAAFAYPSYSLYYTMAEANSVKYEKIKLRDDFTYDLNKFLEKDYGLAILCSPNNPTGTTIPLKDIKDFAAKFKGLIVIDEAYVDFYGETSVSLVNSFDNIIVTRSFSKSYSLAGIRVGIAIASKDIIRGFLKLKDSYNVNKLSAAAAQAALHDVKGFKYNLEMMRNNKEYLEERLAELGFEVVPSKANFLFVRHSKVPAGHIYEELKKRYILIRHFSGDIQENYNRISVGTMMEIKKLVDEMSAIIDEYK